MRRFAGEARQETIFIGWRSVCCVLTVLCIGAGMFSVREADAWSNHVTLVCTQNELTDAQIEKMHLIEYEREDGVAFTAWKEYHEKQIYDKDKVKSCQVTVIELNGSSELLFSGGKILHREDVEGCFLSESAAEKIFGSHDVEGLTLRYEDRLLMIRDVIQESEELVVIEGDGESSCYDRITLLPSWDATDQRLAERFVNRHGLSVEHLRYDIFNKDYLLELIPQKWSDFEGWKRSLEGIYADINLLLQEKKSAAELDYIKISCKALVGYGAGVIFCIIAIRMGKRKKNRT